MVKATRELRICDEWLKACALELASAAAKEPDPVRQRELTQHAIDCWNQAHGRGTHA